MKKHEIKESGYCGPWRRPEREAGKDVGDPNDGYVHKDQNKTHSSVWLQINLEKNNS